MMWKKTAAVGAALALFVGVAGANVPAQAVSDVDAANVPAVVESAADALTPDADAPTPVQSDGVQIVDRARGMTLRMSDPKQLGFLQVPCTKSMACPEGTNLIVRMNEKVKLTGRVSGVAAGAPVIIKRAALTNDGSIGPWVQVATASINDQGRFTKRVRVPSGAHLLQVKFANEREGSSQRAIGGTFAVSGLPLMYVNYVNQMKQKEKYNLNLYVTTTIQTSSSCTTSTDGSDPCPVYQSQAIELNAAGEGATTDAPQTLRFAYLLPVGGPNTNSTMTFGFYLQKQDCVGKCSTFLTNFNAGVHGDSCGKLSTPPSTYMTSGSQWTVYLQEQTTGYNAFLDGPNMPASKNSKKYPNGCVFAVQTEFDNDIASLGIVGWLKVALRAYKDVTAVAKLVETGGADGKLNAFRQARKTWKMIASIPNPPDWADMGACKVFAEDVNATLNNQNLFGGMIAYRNQAAGRTSLIFGDAECTVPDTIYGETLGLVRSRTIS